MSIHFTSECWHWMPDSEIVLKRDFGIEKELYARGRNASISSFIKTNAFESFFFQGKNIAPHISAIHRT